MVYFEKLVMNFEVNATEDFLTFQTHITNWFPSGDYLNL